MKHYQKGFAPILIDKRLRIFIFFITLSLVSPFILTFAFWNSSIPNLGNWKLYLALTAFLWAVLALEFLFVTFIYFWKKELLPAIILLSFCALFVMVAYHLMRQLDNKVAVYHGNCQFLIGGSTDIVNHFSRTMVLENQKVVNVSYGDFNALTPENLLISTKRGNNYVCARPVRIYYLNDFWVFSEGQALKVEIL